MDSAKLKEQFAKDPAAVFLDVLRSAGERLTAKKITSSLIEHGLPETSIKAQWKKCLDIIKYHPYVARPTTMSYEWREKPVDPDEAFVRLLALLTTTSKSKARARDELAEVVRSGLKAAGDLTSPDDEVRFRVTQERQSQIDGLLAVAELAGEIEELAHNSGDPDVIVERVQTRVQALSLEQIGRSGEQARFDPSLHEAIGARPSAGSPVTIVRPGYSWRNDKEAVLLQRAQIAVE